MTAQSVGIFTILFPDPYEINYYNDRFNTLAQNISFQYPIRDNIQTLTTKNVERGNDPYGILYVPDLRSDDCKKSEEEHVPSNATRLANLPQNTEYALIAIAPWFSPACMIEYFEAARQSPVKGFLVYQPGTSAATPPVMNDASWTLGDGGSWKTANNFPTYALASISGSIVMEKLSLYSGNISDVPYGDELVSMFSPTDYVRLWATVNTEWANQLPSLWVFLVIVLGLLILVICSTSFFMHLVQRRRRNSLRQRVINGEIDLEALGVKRLTVPRQYLEKLPLYTYSAGVTSDAEKTAEHVQIQAQNIPSPTIEGETGAKLEPLARRSSAPDASTSGALPAFSQPTCPICLDDFEPNETQVRELPCRHIFHPDCVDTFLLSNSSLCPMCKKSVLPTGYCPKITNVMVRRERIISRMRARAAANGRANGDAADTQPQSPAPRSPPRVFGSLGSRIGGTAVGRRIFSAPERTQPRPPDIEMADSGIAPPTVNAPSNPSVVEISSAPAPAPDRSSSVPDCVQPATPNRREWARQRAMALLGNRQVPGDDEEENSPRWRRGLRKIFPGFR